MSRLPVTVPTQLFDEPRPVTWRDEKYSDSTRTIGDKHYAVHRQVLAGGSRGSLFFAGAFGGPYSDGKARADLTEMLPIAAHATFALAVDYMYGDLASADILPDIFAVVPPGGCLSMEDCALSENQDERGPHPGSLSAFMKKRRLTVT
jgi:hypothetical protein